MPTKWVIEAELIFLEPAAEFAKLDPNAIREYPGPGSIGALGYPSPFCRTSISWMRALSHLVVRDREFALYLVTIKSEKDPQEIARTRVYPTLDDDVLEVLHQINDSDNSEWRRQSQRVKRTLERMRKSANLALEDELKDLYPDESLNSDE